MQHFLATVRSTGSIKVKRFVDYVNRNSLGALTFTNSRGLMKMILDQYRNILPQNPKTQIAPYSNGRSSTIFAVVVHELCHLLEHTHSVIYWHHVERIISDFQKCREWLKQNSERL